MKAIKWVTFLALILMLAGLMAIACGDDDDDDDDGAPSEDDDDTVDDDDDTTDDDDDAADDDDDTTDDDDDVTDDDDDDDDDLDPFHLAYIYDTDDILALDFETFFEGLGHTVDLHDISELSTDKAPDFSDVDVFMVDNNADDTDWDATNSAVLTDTGKPIIGNAYGIYVFEFLSQYLQGANSMGNNGAALEPKELAHTVWSTPNDLGATGTPINIVTTVDPHHITLGDDNTVPAGVEFLGKSNLKGMDEYYSLAVQDGIYALWGFGEHGPSDYAQDGKDLLENLVYYLMSN